MRKWFGACALALAGVGAGAQATGAGSAVPLDLNTATAAQLRALPGMGDAYVKRIVEGRPYTMKNQLVQKGILPQAAYDRIKERIVAHRAVSAVKK
jgi:competence protein ComEA